MSDMSNLEVAKTVKRFKLPFEPECRIVSYKFCKAFARVRSYSSLSPLPIASRL